MKKLIVASLLMVALVVGGVVSAFSQPHGPSEQGENYLTRCIVDKLTEEQKEALSQLVQELTDAGATPEEIQKAIQQFLEEQGIDAEDCEKSRNRHREYVNDCIADQLTEEQKEALSQLIQDLRDAGATPEEIQKAIQQFLEEQGIDTEKCQQKVGPKGTKESKNPTGPKGGQRKN